MELFVVDESKCARDGLCSAACPLTIITMREEGAVPEPRNRAADLCISCGHCVAVCPNGALSHRDMSPDQCPPRREELLLGADQAEHFLRSRRSIRNYKDEPVEKETIARLIDIARYGPSGHNTQPVKWLVIHDRDALRRMVGMVIDCMRDMLKRQPEVAKDQHLDIIVGAYKLGFDAVCRGAPHIIVAHAPRDAMPAPAACTIAIAYLELAAPALGLGTCWGGYFMAAVNQWAPLKKALSLPDEEVAYGAVMVGYPKFRYRRLPVRNRPEVTWR
ncbi:nitroreductase family protein [Thermodesulfobacteriota bacterium]